MRDGSWFTSPMDSFGGESAVPPRGSLKLTRHMCLLPYQAYPPESPIRHRGSMGVSANTTLLMYPEDPASGTRALMGAEGLSLMAHNNHWPGRDVENPEEAAAMRKCK